MKKNNKKGFTLVELVIVVAVMAILVAVAIPVVGSVTDKAQKAVNETNANTIESMIKLEAANLQVDSTTGKITVTEDTVVDALTDAKLGIESGTFYYVVDTGAVVLDAPTGKNDGTDYFTITYVDGALTAPTKTSG